MSGNAQPRFEQDQSTTISASRTLIAPRTTGELKCTVPTERAILMTFSNNKEQTPENQGIAFSRSTSSQKVVRGTLLAACMIGTALNGTTQGQEYSRVNSAGGPGLNQFSTSISSTADGAAVVWLETKDGKQSIRMRRVNGQGEGVDEENRQATGDARRRLRDQSNG